MTKGEIEEQKLRQLKKRLVSNARAILSNQIGLPFGVQKMTKILTWIKNVQPLDMDVKIFDDYYNETGGIPLGPERLNWNIESLKREDKKLHELTDKFRDDILDKCSELIKTYGQ